MSEQNHEWKEGDPVEADAENPTGILSKIVGEDDKVLLAPLDAPNEVSANEAVIQDHPGGEVVYDLTYAYEQGTQSFVKQ
jgi:hypothetical protein